MLREPLNSRDLISRAGDTIATFSLGGDALTISLSTSDTGGGGTNSGAKVGNLNIVAADLPACALGSRMHEISGLLLPDDFLLPAAARTCSSGSSCSRGRK